MSDIERIIDTKKAIAAWDESEKAMNARMAGYNDAPSSMRVEPFRIFGPLYYVGDKIVCSHLLDTGDGLILFDSGVPNAAAQLFRSIETLGFSLKGIKYIFHSHEHFDHFGASRRLQAAYGCKTFIHTLGAETFRLHPHHTEIQSSGSPEAALFIPDVELSDGDEIVLGDSRIQCIHTPGHSAGSCTYLFDVREGSKTFQAGICGINGLMTLHAGRLAKYGIPLTVWDDYQSSMQRLKAEFVDIALDTHPRAGGILERRHAIPEQAGTNPFIDPSAWRNMLEDYESRFLQFKETQKPYFQNPAG